MLLLGEVALTRNLLQFIGEVEVLLVEATCH